MKDLYWRRARLKQVLDGDTVRFLVDLGYRIYSEHSIRLVGVVAPKTFRAETEAEREAGVRARSFVIKWFITHASCTVDGFQRERWPYSIHSERSDGFGRFLGTIVCSRDHSLNKELLNSGLVKRFEAIE